MTSRHLSEAKAYEAPNHRACSSLRLFGAEAGGSKTLIVGVSHFLPGRRRGSRRLAAGEGLLCARRRVDRDRRRQGDRTEEGEQSCFIGPNESREIINRGNDVCTMLVAVVDAAEVIAGRHHCDAAGSSTAAGSCSRSGA